MRWLNGSFRAGLCGRLAWRSTALVFCALAMPVSARSACSQAHQQFAHRLANLLEPLQLRDEGVLSRIRSLGDRLAAADSTRSADAELELAVLADPLPNAFSSPCGRVYATTGLLDLCRSEDELAGVLAREIALVRLDAFALGTRGDHTAQTMTRLFLAGATAVGIYFVAVQPVQEVSRGSEPSTSMANIVLPFVGGFPGMLLERSWRGRIRRAAVAPELMAGRGAALTIFDMDLLRVVYEGYDPATELQADHQAVELATRAGFAPEGLATLLERLHTQGGTRQSHLKSTRPGLARRLQNLGWSGPKVPPPHPQGPSVREDFE